MYLKLSFGFLVASLLQFGLIELLEWTRISNLGPEVTFLQILIHVIVGQIGGFILLYLYRKFHDLRDTNYWITGAVYGVVVWAILIPIQANFERVNNPWDEGAATLIASAFTFAIYGIIAAYTIERYGFEKARH